MAEEMTVAQYPREDQLAALRDGAQDQPVVMLNLLRFKRHADGADSGSSGRAAYQQYAARMQQFVESKGGRFLWTGRVDSQVIGSGGEEFHVAALVEYPSRRAFLEIAGSAHVREIGVHRSAGLAGQWLLATTTVVPAAPDNS